MFKKKKFSRITKLNYRNFLYKLFKRGTNPFFISNKMKSDYE